MDLRERLNCDLIFVFKKFNLINGIRLSAVAISKCTSKFQRSSERQAANALTPESELPAAAHAAAAR